MNFVTYILIPVLCVLALIIIYLLFKGRTFKKLRFQVFSKNIWPYLVIILLCMYLVTDDRVVAAVEEVPYLGGTAVFKAIIFFSLAALGTKLVRNMVRILNRKNTYEQADNLRQRKFVTQLQYVEKIILLGLWLLAISFALLSFERFEKIGTGLLASAGIVSIVMGFAAQKSLSNLLAGFQIAFTQPIRIDDAVVVENEWGWIEEINLTYIVVKIWDQRRLVLPITYFVEKPFQNWTRKSSEILGSVQIFVNYEADIEDLQRFLKETVEKSPLWDKRVQVLQVVNFHEQSVELRALVSAKNSPQTWDLRCFVRAELMKYLQEKKHTPIWPQRSLELHKRDQASS